MLHVAGLLLAAGEGARLGRPKALVELDGERLVDRGVRVLAGGGCDPVITVCGAAPLDVPGALVVTNPQWRTGMGSSLCAGLDALPVSAAAVVIGLVDQPRVRIEAVRRLLRAYEAGAGVAVAAYDGAPRNPALFSREYWPAVRESATGDVGARPFIRSHPELVTLVDCGDVASPDDVDTPEDLARLDREPPGRPG